MDNKFSPVNPVLPPENWGGVSNTSSIELLKKLDLTEGKILSLEVYILSESEHGKNLDYDTIISGKLSEPVELDKPIKFKNNKFTGIVESIHPAPVPNQGKYVIKIGDSSYLINL